MRRVGRAVALVAEAIALLVGLAFAAAGGGLLYGSTQRDARGFVLTPYERVATAGYALVAEAGLGLQPRRYPFLGFLPESTVLVLARPAGPVPLFVGVGPARAVEAYLAGHAYDEITNPVLGPFEATYRSHPGTGAPAPPQGASPWTASDSGRGTLTVRVPPGREATSVVLMRADGRPGVTTELAAGIDGSWFLPLGVALGVSGLALLVTASLLMVATTRSGAGGTGRGKPAPPATAPGAPWGPGEDAGRGAASGTTDVATTRRRE